MAPSGYIKLPSDIRCRCVNLWQANGDFWCCQENKERYVYQERPTDKIERLRKEIADRQAELEKLVFGG